MTHYGPLIRMVHGRISQAVNAHLASVELTSSQGHIMGYLAMCKEPPCPRDVEEQFHLTHATVSGLLSRLERKEFIALQPDPNDRRCKRIRILPKGRECNGSMYRSMMETEERIVQDFTEEEKQLFDQFLHRAARNMGAEPHFGEQKEETNP